MRGQTGADHPHDAEEERDTGSELHDEGRHEVDPERVAESLPGGDRVVRPEAGPAREVAHVRPMERHVAVVVGQEGQDVRTAFEGNAEELPQRHDAENGESEHRGGPDPVGDLGRTEVTGGGAGRQCDDDETHAEGDDGHQRCQAAREHGEHRGRETRARYS